jgi:hypothetical protein
MLIHCTMEELIAIRDARGSAVAKEHLEGCDECMMEMERVYQTVAALKALPAIDAPRDRWTAIKKQAVAERKSENRSFFGWTGLAAAAVLALTFGAQTGIMGHQSKPDDRVVTLMEQSQSLENMLREIKPQGRVINGRLAFTVVRIEDQIRLVDDRLSQMRNERRPSTQDLEILWVERVRLMDQLVIVRSNRATYVRF